jgi:hypothetical protein
MLMKPAFLITIVFAASTMLFAQNAKAATEGAMKFDGTWAVTLDAKAYKNPNGSTAQPYVWRFSATVKNGVFQGERGMRSKPGWYELNGQIGADGTANLRADEITGSQEHNISKSVKPPPGKGISYSYQVAAHFDGHRGTGRSTSDPRTRILTFVKN